MKQTGTVQYSSLGRFFPAAAKPLSRILKSWEVESTTPGLLVRQDQENASDSSLMKIRLIHRGRREKARVLLLIDKAVPRAIVSPTNPVGRPSHLAVSRTLQRLQGKGEGGICQLHTFHLIYLEGLMLSEVRRARTYQRARVGATSDPP